MKIWNFQSNQWKLTIFLFNLINIIKCLFIIYFNLIFNLFFAFNFYLKINFIRTSIKSYASCQKESRIHFRWSWIRKRNSMRSYRQKVQLCSFICWITFERRKKNSRITIRWNYSKENWWGKDRTKWNHCFFT